MAVDVTTVMPGLATLEPSELAEAQTQASKVINLISRVVTLEEETKVLKKSTKAAHMRITKEASERKAGEAALGLRITDLEAQYVRLDASHAGLADKLTEVCVAAMHLSISLHPACAFCQLAPHSRPLSHPHSGVRRPHPLSHPQFESTVRTECEQAHKALKASYQAQMQELEATNAKVHTHTPMCMHTCSHVHAAVICVHAHSCTHVRTRACTCTHGQMIAEAKATAEADVEALQLSFQASVVEINTRYLMVSEPFALQYLSTCAQMVLSSHNAHHMLLNLMPSEHK